MKLSKLNNVILVLFVLFIQLQSVAQSQSFKNDSHPGNFYTIEKKYSYSYIDGYNIYVPKSCTPESEAFPVIVFLQGGLAVGGKVDTILNWGLPKILKETSDIKSELDNLRLNTFVFIMPHLSSMQFYFLDSANNAITKIIEEVSEKYNVDKKRIYLTGLSRGGHGTWGIASKIPEKFAAIAPICGRPNGIENYSNLIDLPIWTSHNTGDDVVAYDGTVKTIQKIEQLSGKKFHRTDNISTAEYKTNDRIFTSGNSKDHNAWTEMYNDANFYKWLLRFHK